MSFLLAFDQGTTSCRAILFDHSGSIVDVSQRELQQHYPQPGWVEQDANTIWELQLGVARDVLQKSRLTAADIAAIGIANQRETTVLWDRADGRPIYNAIVWQDRRTAGYCDSLCDQGHSEIVQQKTGLVVDPYFCATKIRWLLDQVPGARQKAEKGELAFGTIDSWLAWQLTGGRLHMTDVTNASRTMLWNIHTGEWDEALLELFQIPRSLLPEVFPSSQVFAETEPELFGGPVRFAGVAGDQQAALFGQNCTQDGMAKNTYGTGCFMLMNTGGNATSSKNKLLTTMTAAVGRESNYALEGSVFIAGAVVQWLRDGLQIIESSDEVEALATSVADSDGVYVVPAFAGLGAPYWDSYARGTIVGITRGTNRAHIARASLEGIAFQVADVFDAMKQDSGKTITELRVDGGAAANNFLMQFQADIMQVPVVRPEVIETTALGAAFLAGLAVEYWKDIEEIQRVWRADRVFEPQGSANEWIERRNRWSEALRRSQSWEQEK